MPRIKYCVPERARRALSNSILRLQNKIKKQLSINETLNFYHRKNCFKKYSLEIFDPPPVPLSKAIPFDTARRPLSNDISKIVISKTNMDIRFEKLIKQTPKEIFHLPIRFRMCATCEKYSIRLILKRSID